MFLSIAVDFGDPQDIDVGWQRNRDAQFPAARQLILELLKARKEPVGNFDVSWPHRQIKPPCVCSLCGEFDRSHSLQLAVTFAYDVRLIEYWLLLGVHRCGRKQGFGYV